MRVIESCAECLYDKQRHLSNDPAYLSEIQEIIRNRAEDDSAPYLVYLFGKVYEKHFGPRKPYAEIKRKYNDLVLIREETIRQKIEDSDHPLQTALGYARVGNYIDFGAMNVVRLAKTGYRPAKAYIFEGRARKRSSLLYINGSNDRYR